MLNLDYVINGNPTGDVASALLASNCDANVLRPWIGDDGRTYITKNTRNAKGVIVPTSVPVANATASLRKDDWIQLDNAIIEAARPRLRLVADLRAAGLEYGIPDGMGVTVLQSENVGDISGASVSMDGMRQSQNDSPLFDIANLPLPIIHKDFNMSVRNLASSRRGGSPLDTTMAALAGKKVAEEAEKLAIGVSDYNAYSFGGGAIYGITSYTGNLLKTLTSPASSGWTGATLVQEVLEMILQSRNAYHYGPWMIYCSPSWSPYLDDDYSANKGTETLRDRIKRVEGIQDVRTLDYMQNYDLCLVQMAAETVRIVVGMEITTVQWESKGGMQQNFKVMGILVPQIRGDQDGNIGIVKGSV